MSTSAVTKEAIQGVTTARKYGKNKKRLRRVVPLSKQEWS